MLLSNATPELTRPPRRTARRPTSTSTARSPGTIADKDGQGTGFNSVQANTAGTQYKASLIDLTGGTPADHLDRRQELGNVEQPGQRAAGARRRQPLGLLGRGTRILGPTSDLTAGFQQKAIYFGPDQNNYLKLEIEHRTDTPGVFLTAFLEVGSTTSMIGQTQLIDPASVSTLDFQITGDLETGTLQGGLPDQLVG